MVVKIKMPIHSGKARQQNKQEDTYGYRKLSQPRILGHLKLWGGMVHMQITDDQVEQLTKITVRISGNSGQPFI